MPRYIGTDKKNVRIKKVDMAPHSIRSEARVTIEDTWKILMDRRKDLFNSALLRVLDFEENDDHTVINAVADVMYKDVTGLRYDKGMDARPIADEDVFKVLSSYLFVVTADEKLVFIERDSGDWDKALDLPGGFVQDRFNIENLADFARKRTCEDFGIGEHHIESVEFQGFFDFFEILELMSIYKVKLNLTMAELRIVSGVTFYEVPDNYTAQTHGEHFDMHLHRPCFHVLECFLRKVKGEAE